MQNFGNKSVNNSDFYIQNAGNENVIFSTVELSRAQLPDTGFITTALAAFDTVCINSALSPNSFVLHASLLDGSNIQIGPLKNCSFSTSANGNFTDTLFINNYSNNTINQTIYVKINTSSVISVSGNIPITGGGKKKVVVKVTCKVSNTSPTLSAAVTNITCYNNKNGSIDFANKKNGKGQLTYKWTNDFQQFWSATTQDISNLQPANYTVVIKSAYGCSISKTYPITQPKDLVTTVTQDSNIICKGGSTTVTVSAAGGTIPYTGTGSFLQSSGFKLYSVTDAHSCTDQRGLNVSNGLLSAPSKPDGIRGPDEVKKLSIGNQFQDYESDLSNLYTWVFHRNATIISGQNAYTIIVSWVVKRDQVTINK